MANLGPGVYLAIVNTDTIWALYLKDNGWFLQEMYIINKNHFSSSSSNNPLAPLKKIVINKQQIQLKYRE